MYKKKRKIWGATFRLHSSYTSRKSAKFQAKVMRKKKRKYVRVIPIKATYGKRPRKTYYGIFVGPKRATRRQLEEGRYRGISPVWGDRGP